MQQHYPTCGVITLHVRVPLGFLSAEQSNPKMLVWNSMNQLISESHLDPVDGTAILTVNTDCHYLAAERNVAWRDAKFAVSDKQAIPTDAALWFELSAQSPGIGNRMVYDHSGTGAVDLKDIVAASLGKNALKTPLLYNDIPTAGANSSSGGGNEGFVKAVMDIESIELTTHGDQIRRLPSHNALFAPCCGLLNIAAPSSLAPSMAQQIFSRSIYPFSTRSVQDGLQYQGTWKIDTAVIAPTNPTCVGPLWAATYVLNRNQNPLTGVQPVDEQFYATSVRYALLRHNLTERQFNETIRAQVKRTDSKYDPLFTDCAAAVVTACMVLSTSLPYQSDFKDVGKSAAKIAARHESTEMRLAKRTIAAAVRATGAASASAPVSSASTHIETESYDDLVRRGGGDCEDSARLGFAIARRIMLGAPQNASSGSCYTRDGGWKDEALASAQMVLHYYFPMMELATVTQPALGNNTHSVEKNEVHTKAAIRHHATVRQRMLDDEMHELTLRHTSATTSTEDEAKLHAALPVINSSADLSTPIGGHMFLQFHPVVRVAEWVQRAVPDTDAATGESNAVRSVLAATVFGRDASLPAWTLHLPSLVGEGTGREDPRLLPRVAYCSPDATLEERQRVHAFDVAEHVVRHRIVSESPIFHAMETIAIPMATANLGDVRATPFYRHVTQVFTDQFLRTSGIASFQFLQTRDRLSALGSDALVAKIHALGNDALYQTSAALLNRTNIEAQKSNVRIALRSVMPSHVASYLKANTLHSAATAVDQLHQLAVATGNNVDNTPENEALVEKLAMRSALGYHTPLQRSNAAIAPSQKPTFGIEIEDTLHHHYSSVALVPCAGIDRIEAQLVAKYLHHTPPMEEPSMNITPYKAPMGSSASAVAVLRVGAAGTIDPDAPARLCVDNEKLVAEHRSRVMSLLKTLNTVPAGQQWPSRTLAQSRHEVAVSFFFGAHDVCSDAVTAKVSSELRRLTEAGLVKMSRAYVESPCNNLDTVVLQLLCSTEQFTTDQALGK